MPSFSSCGAHLFSLPRSKNPADLRRPPYTSTVTSIFPVLRVSPMFHEHSDEALLCPSQRLLTPPVQLRKLRLERENGLFEVPDLLFPLFLVWKGYCIEESYKPTFFSSCFPIKPFQNSAVASSSSLIDSSPRARGLPHPIIILLRGPCIPSDSLP